ncbi:MAG: hypothetical protein MUP33_05115 [Polaromonas sp.]|nr:hypothetical protein [Polaromonas sp.]
MTIRMILAALQPNQLYKSAEPATHLQLILSKLREESKKSRANTINPLRIGKTRDYRRFPSAGKCQPAAPGQKLSIKTASEACHAGQADAKPASLGEAVIEKAEEKQ